jgi:hypothetical protein
VIAIGVLAMSALTGCRSDAGSAAYVGNTRITGGQVNDVVADIPPAVAKGATHAELESVILQTIVFNKVAAQFAADKGYGTAKPDQSDVAARAQNFGVSTSAAGSNKFVQLLAESDAWQALLLSKMPAGAATEADYKAVFDELSANNELKPGTTFAAVEPEIKQYAPANLAQANNLRQQLNAASTGNNVEINPRYQAACTAAPCGGLGISLTELTVTDPQSGQATQQIPIMMPTIAEDKSPVVLDLPSASPSPAPAG